MRDQKAPSCRRSRTLRSLSTKEMNTSSTVGGTARADAANPAAARRSTPAA